MLFQHLVAAGQAKLISKPFLELGAIVMERKVLLGNQQRAERQS